MNRRTHCSRVIVLLLAASYGGVGCSSNSSFTLNPFAKRKAPQTETLPAARWAELKRENAARLAGEGIPRSAASTRPAAPAAQSSKGGGFESFVDSIEYVFWTLPKRAVKSWTG